MYEDGIERFDRNPSSGALVFVDMTSISADSPATAATIDPSGDFVVSFVAVSWAANGHNSQRLGLGSRGPESPQVP